MAKCACSGSQTPSGVSSLLCSFLPLIFLAQLRRTGIRHFCISWELVWHLGSVQHIWWHLVTLFSGGYWLWDAFYPVGLAHKCFLFYNLPTPPIAFAVFLILSSCPFLSLSLDRLWYQFSLFHSVRFQPQLVLCFIF